MPALTIPNSFTPLTIAQSSLVNANFAAIATLLNVTLLDNTNIQSEGIATDNIATGAVTTAKIADANVTSAKLAADAIALCSPSGAIMAYGGTSAPTGWLLCDGTSYLRATYAALYTAIGNAFGTADGTHFNVPDLRGYFLRGRDAGTGVDPDAAGRTALATGGNSGDNVGSKQAHSYQAHEHSVAMSSGAAGPDGLKATGIGQALNDAGLASAVRGEGGTNTNSGTETRPVNVNVTYIIKT